MNRLWIMRNIELVTVFVMLTFPIWILPYGIYQLYATIRDELWRAV